MPGTMTTPSHSRNASQESNASYSQILEHILQYPGSYEIPLRTMYTLNCIPRAQPPARSQHSGGTSPTEPSDAATEAKLSANEFTSSLLSQIQQLPAQQCSLPPVFTSTFIRRVFHSQLTLVDFPQALTALDYLKDLEMRRRREIAAVYDRLGLKPEDTAENDLLAEQYPALREWLETLEVKKDGAISRYSQIYVGLRQWVMINELSLTPFNKQNCLSMLNTLYPPHIHHNVTPQVTPQLLLRQRQSFLKYVNKVQTGGTKLLQPLITLNKNAEDETGWPRVQAILEQYIDIAKDTIDDCGRVSGIEDFGRAPAETPTAVEASKRKGRQVDSGVSFGSDKSRRTTSTDSSNSTGNEAPASPVPTLHRKKSSRGLSTLEKITREFKKMRRSNKVARADLGPDVASSEPALVPAPPADGARRPSNTLKKVKSATSMRSGNTALSSMSKKNSSLVSFHAGRRMPDDMPEFDAEAMKKQREEFEARSKKQAKKQLRRSH